MKVKFVAALLFLIGANGVSIFLAHAERNWADPNSKPICAKVIADSASSDRTQRVLRSPETVPRLAIRSILSYLAQQSTWTGMQKYAEWKQLVHYYNQNQPRHWLVSPCMQTVDQEMVCWGEHPGNLLVFTPQGQIFRSFNLNRPNPVPGLPYCVDWSDPTLQEEP